MKTFLIIFVLINENQYSIANLQDDINCELHKEHSTTLSRKRRYLIFPEGSSFQVVFDLTIPSVAIEGNVFTYGNTAAMAWELPSKPIKYDGTPIRDDIDEKPETTTMEPIPEYLDYDPAKESKWQPPMAWSYSNQPSDSSNWNSNNDRSSITYYSNPYQSKNFQYNSNNVLYKDRTDYYHRNPSQFWSYGRSLSQASSSKTNSYYATLGDHIHRRSKRKLYERVEKLLTAMTRDGKACVLKAICQVHKLPKKKGTMWEEIIKALFKSRYDQYPEEDHYDKAANASHDCDEMYPSCDGHVLSNLFKNKINKI